RRGATTGGGTGESPIPQPLCDSDPRRRSPLRLGGRARGYGPRARRWPALFRPDCSGTAFRRSGIAFGRRRATRQEDTHAAPVLLRLLEAQGHEVGFLQRVLVLSRTPFGRSAL